jgi:hypothetical protein
MITAAARAYNRLGLVLPEQNRERIIRPPGNSVMVALACVSMRMLSVRKPPIDRIPAASHRLPKWQRRCGDMYMTHDTYDSCDTSD